MGKTIIVTGAASGIGAAICRAMAGPDTAILLHTRRNQAGAERVADQVRALGAEAAVVLGDLSEPNAAATAIEAAVKQFGGIDILISNAGFADRTPMENLTGQL